MGQDFYVKPMTSRQREALQEQAKRAQAPPDFQIRAVPPPRQSLGQQVSMALTEPRLDESPKSAYLRGLVGGSAGALTDAVTGIARPFAQVLYNGMDATSSKFGLPAVTEMMPETSAVLDAPTSAAGRIGEFAGNSALYAPAMLAGGGLPAIAAESAISSGLAGLQTKGDPTAMAFGALGPATMSLRGLMPKSGVGRFGKIATDTVIGGGAGYLASGGDPDATAAGMIGLPVATSAAAGARLLKAPIVSAAAGSAEGGLGGALAGAVRHAAPEDPTRMMVQAAKPRNAQVDFEKSIAVAAPEVKAVAERYGIPLNNIDNVLEATKRAKLMVRSQYDQVLGPYRTVGAAVDLSPVADEMTKSITSKLRLENPEAAARLEATADLYRRPFKITEVEQLLKETNAELDGYYDQFPGQKRRELLANPQVASLEAQARAMRKAVYGIADHPSLPPVARELNSRYGRLMDFEQTLQRRKNVANRQQPESLAEQIAQANAVADRVAGAFQLGRSALTGDVRGMISGGADIVRGHARGEMSRYMKQQQTTDALLRRAFKRIDPAVPMELPIIEQGESFVRGHGSYPLTAGRQPVALLESGLPPAPEGVTQLPSRTQQFEMPPSSEAASSVKGVAADRVVQRDPRTGQMQRVYTGEETGTAKQRAGSPYTPVLSVMPNAAAQAIPEDPESDWDNYARTSLNLGGVAAMGMAGAKALKNNGWKPVKQIEGGGFEKFTETGQRGFQFRPIDQAARARLESFKPGAHFSFAKLPLTARPTAIYKAITAPGSTGYSVHPGTGQLIKGGEPGPRMVGIFPNSSQRTAVIPLAKFRPMDVEKFMLKNRAEFAKDPTLFVGGWQSQINGVPHVFLDVSRAVDNSRIATKIGELQNPGGKLRSGKVVPPKAGEVQITRKPDGTWPKAQEEIFEPENFKPAEGDYGGRVVGNHAEFVGSPDFQQRVHEMAGVGRVLMNDGNWWDIRGGPFERVYGPEMTEKVAGYTASTSPQNPPRPNLRMATELIRRDIKGEPVHDPNWRAPSDAMGEGFSPGPGMPMPAPDTWKNNATKVREGRPETMFDDKVNDMFHAMIGKLVGVFDRHWAKLAEDPARGIYTDKVINRIQGSMKSGVLEAYPLIENAVRNAAKQAGVDVARYSAWAWEGIRHTIKTTGKLYGQSHPAGAIPEGNEGFNEIFEQLLSEKAAHMKISVAELEGRLRRGEASLLTALLATPVGAAAYSRWRDSGQSNPEGGGS